MKFAGSVRKNVAGSHGMCNLNAYSTRRSTELRDGRVQLDGMKRVCGYGLIDAPCLCRSAQLQDEPTGNSRLTSCSRTPLRTHASMSARGSQAVQRALAGSNINVYIDVLFWMDLGEVSTHHRSDST